MFVRIVKMGFKPEEIETFLSNFDQHKEKIRGFEGCEFLELYRDKNNTNQFFTYSYWKDETALENYRNSNLFNEVWAETKVMFNQKPEAWSVDKVVSIP
ncbi:antibiotic biosynthesis monooxygenase [Antarcticibacterium flavum]|uniref:Antibiotic biosynthesis monooxygenase n=1 Tax=Antarcticibacterium flavum TaxID=2058175 RepID=A0A5B7WZD4_9FLAO|nr:MULTISPECIES: antibiotic biosynthesis monooxygenase family protein [Antarcticibacterium]MCM4161780.1 antibiotic biosynthesis monooxygenase [Antarcticibacterium sp. W02-3]QCY68357.1 antibiotic biosynthesis monooxygenase [Antarcticibacterium flavum]